MGDAVAATLQHAAFCPTVLLFKSHDGLGLPQVIDFGSSCFEDERVYTCSGVH